MIISAAGPAAEPEWKQYIQLGEQLLHLTASDQQRTLIIDTIQDLLPVVVDLWLAGSFYPLPGQPYEALLPDPAAPDLVQQVYQTQQMVALPSPHQINRYIAAAFPLISREDFLGVMLLTCHPGASITDDRLVFLQGLTATIALAMQASRQAWLKNLRLEQLSLVRSVSAQIANLLDLDELCERVTSLIQKTFHYYYVAIFTLDTHAIPQFRACASLNDGTNPPAVFQVEPGQGLIGLTAKTGEEVLAADVHAEPRYRYIDTLPETLSEFSVPLKVENRVLGVLDIQADRLDAFHEIDRLVLHALADNIALAVEGIRLYNSLQRRAEQITAVFQVSHALTSILDPDLLVEEVTRDIQQAFGYPFVHLFTVHPGRKKVFFRTGSGERAQTYRAQNLTYDLEDSIGIIPYVARTGETLLANDVCQEPHYRSDDLPPYDTNSELTIPLKYGQEVLAVLDIQSDQPNAFDENDRSVLEALSSSIAVALRNANLYRSEQWRRKVADSFRDVAVLLSTNMALPEVLERILTALESNLPCEASAIWLAEENPRGQRSLSLAAVHGINSDALLDTRQQSLEVRQWLDSQLDTPYPNIRQPEDSYGPLGAALQFPPDYSSIVCPLRAGDKILGVLTLAHHSAGRYGSEALMMTTTFASYAAVAIQNTRLFNEAQEQAWISTVLLQVAEANQSVTTLDDLLETTIRLIPMLVGVTKAALLLWDQARQSFVMSKCYGFTSPKEGTVLSETDAPALARLKATHTTIFIENAIDELNLPEAAVSNDTSTLLLMPLLSRGEIQGALLVAHQSAGGNGSQPPFSEQMYSILQGIAHQAAISLENLRLVEAHQEEAYVTAVLLQVAQAVVSINDLNDILDTIVHLMPILVGIDACIIYLLDKNTGTYVPTKAYAGLHEQERDLLKRTYGPGEFALLEQVRSSDNYVLCPLSDSDLTVPEWASQPCLPDCSLPSPAMSAQGSWLIGLPLTVKGEFYGVLLAKETSEDPGSREKRLEIITGVAQEVALAIQNDHLQSEMVVRERMEREIQLAREIQRTFLPDHLPRLPGWEIDARWQTARQVGGDFYDIFRVSEDRLGLVIADVADKGMPAALYMTVTRTLIRSSIHHIHSPARVLERVNNLLVPDAQNGMFVTAILAVVNLKTGEGTYANAGHNRPFLLHASGTVEKITKGGMALGVMTNTPLEDSHFQMQAGDGLILYTDGVTDTFDPDSTAFGDERLQQVLSHTGGMTAHEILDAIDRALADFRKEEPLSDDVTMLCMRRQPARETSLA